MSKDPHEAAAGLGPSWRGRVPPAAASRQESADGVVCVGRNTGGQELSPARWTSFTNDVCTAVAACGGTVRLIGTGIGGWSDDHADLEDAAAIVFGHVTVRELLPLMATVAHQYGQEFVAFTTVGTITARPDAPAAGPIEGGKACRGS